MGIRTCRELLTLEYGSELQTRIQESDVTVGSSPVKLVGGNGARIWISIQTSALSALYISTLSSVAQYQGFIIPSSGFLTFTWKDDGDLPTVALYAVTDGTSGNVHIIEQILTGSGD